MNILWLGAAELGSLFLCEICCYNNKPRAWVSGRNQFKIVTHYPRMPLFRSTASFQQKVEVTLTYIERIHSMPNPNTIRILPHTAGNSGIDIHKCAVPKKTFSLPIDGYLDGVQFNFPFILTIKLWGRRIVPLYWFLKLHHLFQGLHWRGNLPLDCFS